MPWFRGRAGTGDEHIRQQLEEQTASIEALSTGGLPLNAQRRLARVRDNPDSAFTSDLSVNELLLCREIGLRPICQVAGSCIYRVVAQAALLGSGEVRSLSDGINESRALALGRVIQEAQVVGAHAVVALRILSRRLPFSAHVTEFTAIGTAVRLDDKTEGTVPALTNLSGQEFWKLYRAGYWPLGVCASTAVYNVYAPGASFGMGSAFGWYNQELPHFSEGMYRSRDLAVRRVHGLARDLGASGLVGMQIAMEREAGESQTSGAAPTRMMFSFTAIGTAIAELSPGRPVQQDHTEMTISLRG